MGSGDSSTPNVQETVDSNGLSAESQTQNVEKGASNKEKNSVPGSQTGTQLCAKSAEPSNTTDNTVVENTNRTSENESGSEAEEENMETCDVKEKNHAAFEKYKPICRPLKDFMELGPEEDKFGDYLIPEKFFRRFWVMDIVKEKDHNCCCFTKRWGKPIILWRARFTLS